MSDKTRIAYMYVDDPGYESTIPPGWTGLRHLVRNKGRITNVVDDFGDQEIRIYDLSSGGYRGIPDDSSVCSLEWHATDGVLSFLRTYGPFSVLVIGATQVAQLLLRRIVAVQNDPGADLITPSVVISFSRFCEGPGISCHKPMPCAGLNVPFLNVHCPKDYGLLFEFMRDAGLSEALCGEISWETVRTTVDSFNSRHQLSP